MLIDWFRERARGLPWRGDRRDPYHVLVSEVMLQQTQIDRVVPRFESFVERFPTFAALSAAREEDVLEAWSGLGYYHRARLLHRAAAAVDRAGGELPREVSDLEDLPGIGPYTAAAIASICFGVAEPVLDGNTMRVGARVLALDRDPRTAAGRAEVRRWMLDLMEDGSPGEVNEALMELGETICTPRSPACGDCPIRSECAAHERGTQGEIPRRSSGRGRGVEEQRWVAACCVDLRGRWLLERIVAGPVLRGLWLPPLARSADGDDPIRIARRRVAGLDGIAALVLEPVKHSITYRRLTVVPVLFAAGTELEGERVWAFPGAPGRATSSLLGKLASRVRGAGGDERTERR
jgi:A/G-specific adenine glycosylase